MQCSNPSRRAHRAPLLLALTALCAPAAHALVVDFGDVSFAGPESFFNGGPVSNNTGFSSGGIQFTNNFENTYGSWSGFAVSNTTDTTTPGYLNQYSAFTGGGFGDANYGVAYPSAYGASSVLTFATEFTPLSVRLTNTTYAALSMRDGDGSNGPGKKFGGASGDDADFFSVTLTGRNAANSITGEVEFFLADYRDANNAFDYLINTWTLVNLTPLGGNVKTITLTFDSSDVGMFGINTPTYVALDALTAIPEPASYGALTGAAGLLFAAQRRRRV